MNANLIIKASAGTGKTFAIATRYLQLLIFGKAQPEQILALTFSRAAAQEIYDKILERLWTATGANVETAGKSAAEIAAEIQDAAANERKNLVDDEIERLKKAIAEGGLPEKDRTRLEDMAAELKEKAATMTPAFFADLLRRIIAAQHHDTIATLDSFILRIVRSFPVEMGFQKDVSVLDDYGKDRAVEKAVEQVLAETAESKDFMDAFLQAQGNDSVRSGLSKVLAAEKAWGRFLRELAMKVKKEGREGEPEWTADSMCDALGIEVDSPMPDLSAVPVTGNCGKNRQPLDLPDKVVAKLEDYANGKIEYGDLFKNQHGDCMRHLLDNPQATSFTTSAEKNPKTTEFGKDGAEAIRAAVRWAAGKELNRKTGVVVAKMRLAREVERAYDAATRRKGQLTFSDFTDCQAANENSLKGLALQNLQFRLDSQFDHWALDEFQDTSMPQWDCLRRLVEEALSGEGRSVMAVGDFKQSIYAWRGGDDKPFRELIGQVNAAGGATESLDISHRYQQKTADFVNAVFRPDNVREAAKCQCAEGETIRCAEGIRIWEQDCWPKNGHKAKGTDDYVEIVGVPAVAGDDEGDKDGGSKDDEEGDFNPSAAMRVLAPAICKCVREMWEKHEAAKSTDTVGILVRNNADGLYLAERLRATEFQPKGGEEGKTIPVVWEGQSGVLDSPVVRAVLELLWLAEHPEDEFSWAVVNGVFPLRKIVFSEKDGWDSDFPMSADFRAAVSSAIAKNISKFGLARTLRAIVAKLKLKDSPAKLDERTLMRLDELVREGVAFEARPDADSGIAGFRRYLESVSDREIAASPDVVRILTIHRSKGLSITHVIVPVTEKGPKGSILKPKSKGLLAGEGWALESLSENLALANEKTRAAWEEAANRHLLEELRTWYVALTRAKKSTRVFVMDESHNTVQFRDLLLRPFNESQAQANAESQAEAEEEACVCSYGSGAKILLSFGTPPPYGCEKGAAAKEQVKWEHNAPRDFVSHVTPSSGDAVSHSAYVRNATELFSADYGASARRGTDEHAAFAEIERIDPAAPKDDRERDILNRGGAWREAFVLPPGATVWRERSYEILDKAKNTWETGQFDRVVFRVEDGVRTADIYDFKTSRRYKTETAEAFESRMATTYESQMAAYRDAISRLCGIKPEHISSTLLLADTGTSVKVPLS